jgi:hypothetical protein
MNIHEQLQHIKTLMSDELLEAIAAGGIDMASEAEDELEEREDWAA